MTLHNLHAVFLNLNPEKITGVPVLTGDGNKYITTITYASALRAIGCRRCQISDR